MLGFRSSTADRAAPSVEDPATPPRLVPHNRGTRATSIPGPLATPPAATDGQVRILARISSHLFFSRPSAYHREVREWLRANGVDPCNVLVRRDVEILAFDAPAIVREEVTLDQNRKLRWVDTAHGRDILGHEVCSLLIVPLPEHLADPILGYPAGGAS